MKTNLKNRTLKLAKKTSLFCFFICIHIAHAQKDTSRQLNPVVITTQVDTISHISIVTSPVPHFVLTNERLSQMGVRDVGTALNLVPGIQLKDYGGIGGIKTVSFRSLGANHAGVILDGVKIPNVQSGAINLSPFEIFGVSQISFTSGQTEETDVSASAYLNANSIAIQSQLTQKPEKFKLKLYSGNTTISNYESGIFIQAPISKKWFLGVQGFTKFGEGDYPFLAVQSGSDEILRRENSSLFTYKLRTVLGYQFTKGKTLISASYYNNEQELPGAMILYNPSNDQKMWNEDVRFVVTHYQNFGSVRLLAHAFYQSSMMRYYDPDFLNLQGYIDNSYLQKNSGGGVLLKKPIIKNRALVFLGSDFIYSDLSGSSFANPVRYENNSVLGITSEIGKIRMESNLTLQVIQDKSIFSDSSIVKNFLEPSPFISISIKPFDKFPVRFRTFYKRAFTVPTFNDLYYNLIGNTSLKPEKANQFNAGVTFNGMAKKMYCEFSADAFYNLIQDKIIAIPTKDLFNWSMQNISAVKAFGYDVGGLINFKKANWQFTFNGSYSYNLSLDFSDTANTTYKKQIPYTPFHSATGGIIINYKKWTLNSSMLYTGFRYSLNENSYANYLEAFTDISVNLNYELTFVKKIKMNATLSAFNILNKNYEVVRSFPMPGRYYLLKIVVEI